MKNIILFKWSLIFSIKERERERKNTINCVLDNHNFLMFTFIFTHKHTRWLCWLINTCAQNHRFSLISKHLAHASSSLISIMCLTWGEQQWQRRSVTETRFRDNENWDAATTSWQTVFLKCNLWIHNRRH